MLGANGRGGLASCALRPSGIFGEYDTLLVPTTVRNLHTLCCFECDSLRLGVFFGVYATLLVPTTVRCFNMPCTARQRAARCASMAAVSPLAPTT